jgi:hypothetical protein
VIPDVGTGAQPAALCRDDRIAAVRIQSFRNEFFADVRAERVGGIDQIDTAFARAAKHGQVRLGRLPTGA